MSWVVAEGFTKRPLVVVEDHLYHMTELLERLGGPPPLHDQLTVICLDRPGPDTTRAAAGWLAAYPDLQVVAAADLAPAPGISERFRPLPPDAFTHPHRLCQLIAAALRPGGLLLQDIQLETLSFIPPDRWWESIYLASTVRGTFAERPPACRFVSNKRGYEATFGRDLLEAGFDPRDVIDKSDLDRIVVPTLHRFLDRAFPLLLHRRAAGAGSLPHQVRLGRSSAERDEVEAALDLVLWGGDDATSEPARPVPHTAGLTAASELGGQALATAASTPAAAATAGPTGGSGSSARRLLFKPGSQEALTWHTLIADRFAGARGAGAGVAVLDVGTRLAPAGAGRPELTNVAARHLHTLRSRLRDPAAIVTAGHAYRLSEALAVGIVMPAPAATPA